MGKFWSFLLVLVACASPAPSAMREPSRAAPAECRKDDPDRVCLRPYKPEPGPPGSVEGRVLLHGQPVGYFGVGVFPNVGVRRLGRMTEVRNPTGSFQFELLPPNWYTVEIVGPNFETTRDSVFVDPGKTARLRDVHVKPGLTIDGTVVDAGQPIANVTVQIGSMSVSKSPELDRLFGGVRQGTTDRMGYFRIEGVALPSEPSRTSTCMIAYTPTHAAGPIEIQRHNQTMTLELKPTATGAIDGRVFDGWRIHSVVATRASAPSCWTVAEVTDYRFTLEDLPVGEYVLELLSRNQTRRVRVERGRRTSVVFERER